MGTKITFRDVERWIKQHATPDQCIKIALDAAMKHDWVICLEEGVDPVRGFTTGTPEYIDKYFKGDTP
jgi:hypothetical protein